MPSETAEQPSVGAGSATHPTRPRPGVHQARSRFQERRILWRQTLLTCLLALLLLPAGCDRLPDAGANETPVPLLSTQGPSGRLQEVAPPVAVQQLQTALADHNPQVTILAPRDGAILPSGPLTLRLQVRDWPLVDAGALGLGPHVVVQIDDQTPLRVTQSAATAPNGLQIDLPALNPGSHRITAYAARPWGEGVKSPGAWDQIRVHRVAANPLAIPQAGTPQLIPVSPGDRAGQQPVLLDWLLLDAPLQGLRNNDASWRLRVTVNGDSFLVDQNAPLWLQGWQTGSNSVVLELVDGRGEPLNPPFNTQVSEFVLDATGPGPVWQGGRLGADELAQLLGNAPPAPTQPQPAAEPEPTPEHKADRQPEPEPPAEPQADDPQPADLPEPRPATEPTGSEKPTTDPPSSPDQSPGASSQANLEPSAEGDREPEPLVPATPEDPQQGATSVQAEPADTATAIAATATAATAEAVNAAANAPETGPRPVPMPISQRSPASSQRIAPSTSLEGSARNQVNADGSLLKPKPPGPLSGLRQKLGT